MIGGGRVMTQRDGLGSVEASDRLLTLDEVCRKLGGVRPWTIRAWVSQRRIPFTKVGRLTRFPERGIELWIARNTVEPVE